MDKIAADSSLLSPILLATDEEQYDKLATSLVTSLSKLQAPQLGSKDILQNLDPSTQTIPYLYSLAAAVESTTSSGKAAPRQLSAALLPEGALWPYITSFLLTFDPVQVRYAGELLTRLVSVVVQGAEQSRNPIPAIQLLNNVILRLDSSSSTFTSTHHAYVRLCLLAQAYAEAIDILQRPIYHIPSTTDKQTEGRSYKYRCSPHESSATYLTPHMGLTFKVTARGYLEYYLMGALCYLGAGDYKKALTFLEIVLAAPSQQNATSLILIEAYRKWVLLNLLVHGYVPDLPRSAAQTVVKHIRAVAKPYDCVADAFKSKDRSRLQAELEQGTEIWNEDLNYGLIVEVFNAHCKFAISRLGKTYAAIPVAEVARHTSSEPENVAETLAYLQNLIAQGQLQATITSPQDNTGPILRFLPTDIPKPEDQISQDLRSKTAELTVLIKHITDLDHRTEISKEYIDFLRKLKKTREEDKKDAVTAAGGVKAKQPTIMDDGDEDMMEEF